MQDAALAIIINSQDEILLVQRRDVPVWVLPGGGIEPSETPKEALIREILEETSLLITNVQHVATYTPINRLASTTHVFVSEPQKNSALVCQQEEVADARFFPLNKLPKHLFFLHKTFIKEWQEAPLFPISRRLTDITYTTLLLLFLRHPVMVWRYARTRWKKK